MKTITKILILVLVCAFSFCVITGCDKDNDGDTPATTTYTITFVQEGQENVVKTVNKGATLTDIPTPVAEDGYEIVWDVTDFTNIQSDMTVTAVKTAITYTVTFVQEGQDNVVRTVNKGATLTDIPTPVAETGFEIVWDVTDFTNIQSDMTVTAVKTPVYTITFVQEGQDNVIRTAKKGTALTNVPTPVAVTGYDVAWNVTDFSDIQSNMTVTAVTTAKTYTITYVVSDFAASKGVTLAQTQQTVTYGQAFTLFEKPTYTDEVEYVLHAWLKGGVEFTSGTWTLTENVTLTMSYFEPVDVPEWL